MSHPSQNAEREPLIHLSKRSRIHPAKAWGIRLAALALGLITMTLGAVLAVYRPDFRLYMYVGYGHAAYDTAPDYRDRIQRFLMQS